MSTLDEFIGRSWDEHGDDPGGVADRLASAVPQVSDEQDVAKLATLAHHVFGEHLGQWDRGLGFFDELAGRGIAGAAAEGALRRCRASLALCAGSEEARAGMTPGDASRVSGMAAANLASSDTARAARYLEEANEIAEGLANDDPAVRSMAASSNNLAGTLQEKTPLSDAERTLMLHAAALARTYWERAGTWREVERAEYRLAHCWLVAGDGASALRHAQACDEIVRANGNEPLEAFFAAEVIALAAKAMGDGGRAALAVKQAEAAFEGIRQDDQGWCLPTLEKLRAMG